MKNYLLIFVIGVSAVMQSCEIVNLDNPTGEDGEQQGDQITGPNTVPAEESIFLMYLHSGTEKTWEARGFTIFGISGFQDCRLDDTITINADGTYTYDGGTVLCGAEDNQNARTGTWEKVNGENTLAFTEGNNRYIATVTGLDEDQIVLSGKYIGLEIKGAYQSN